MRKILAAALIAACLWGCGDKASDTGDMPATTTGMEETTPGMNGQGTPADNTMQPGTQGTMQPGATTDSMNNTNNGNGPRKTMPRGDSIP